MSNDHRSGTVPTRGTGLTVGFGIVQIPLTIYAGTDAGAKVKRNMFTTDGNPIGNMRYDKATGEPYEGEVVKKVTIDATTVVDLTDEEVAAVTGGIVADTGTIETFVPLSALGSTYIVTAVNQVRPQLLQKAGRKFPNPGAERSFVLLCEAMAEAGVAGLVKVAMRGPARYFALTPDGRLLALAFAEEVRADLPMPDVELTDDERAMAQQLIAAVGTDTPVLADEAGVKLMAYVEAKAAGGDTITTVEAPPVAESSSLADALAASLAAMAPKAKPAKAPAKRAAKATKAPARKVA